MHGIFQTSLGKPYRTSLESISLFLPENVSTPLCRTTTKFPTYANNLSSVLRPNLSACRQLCHNTWRVTIEEGVHIYFNSVLEMPLLTTRRCFGASIFMPFASVYTFSSFMGGGFSFIRQSLFSLSPTCLMLQWEQEELCYLDNIFSANSSLFLTYKETRSSQFVQVKNTRTIAHNVEIHHDHYHLVAFLGSGHSGPLDVSTADGVIVWLAQHEREIIRSAGHFRPATYYCPQKIIALVGWPAGNRALSSRSAG